MNKYTFIKNKEEFLKTKMTTIGASEVATIVGLNKYQTPQELWRIKTGRDAPNEINEAMEWGTRLELPILSKYVQDVAGENTSYLFELDYLNSKIARQFGYKPMTNYFPFTQFRHPTLKHFVIHPDLIDFENHILVEAKTSKHFMVSKENINSYNEEENQIPLYYWIQCQSQMVCSGINQVILKALVDNHEMNFTVNANPKIQEKILIAVNKFWWYIIKDKTPMPSSFSDIKKMFSEVKEKEYYLLGEQSEMATKMKTRKDFLQDKIKKYKSEVDDLNSALGLLIGENKYLYNENNEKLCSQIQFTKEQLASIKEIKEKEPDLYLRLKELDLVKNIDVRFLK